MAFYWACSPHSHSPSMEQRRWREPHGSRGPRGEDAIGVGAAFSSLWGAVCVPASPANSSLQAGPSLCWAWAEWELEA